MKKLISIILSVVLACILFTGCDSNNTFVSNKKYNIVCTLYPQYDWVMQLLGDNADNFHVTLLVDNGTDLHNYQPSAKDMITISTCDLLIYVGGESEQWVQDLIDSSNNQDMTVLNMMKLISDRIYEEETAEGMQAEHDHEDHTHDDLQNLPIFEAHSEEDVEYDEHIWLSLKNTESICKAIASELCKLDFENKHIYDNALALYLDNLDSLDKKYEAMIACAKRNTVLFGDRFPFRYLIEDYGLKYYAAFPGCSAETEASFQTIVSLAEKTDEYHLPAILVTESSDQSVASTIINNTQTKDQQIFVLNSLQSVTSQDMKNGISYLQVMEANWEVLKSVLN